MTQDKAEHEFHSELDDAIDNLFSPYAGGGEAKSAAAASPPAASPSLELAGNSEEPAAAAPEVELPEEFARFDEALLSLEWEISQANIDQTRQALKDVQAVLDPDKAISLVEIFSLMDRILEAMAVAPQSVPTSAPKTMKEGLQTIKAAAASQDMGLIEKTLIDPTLSELRSAVPNIPKDYSKLLKESAAEKTVAPEPVPTAEPEPMDQPAKHEPVEEDELAVDLPMPGGEAPAHLIEAINAHITVLGKCIAKRIIPIENLFGKTPGYEKLHAIHAELRERLEKQKKALISALGGSFKEGVMPPPEAAAPEDSGQTSCPWQELATTTWDGKTVAFVPEQIAYEGLPAKSANEPFFLLKNLKKGFFGKIGSEVRGDLALYDEALLKSLMVPVARPAGGERPAAGAPLVILFNNNAGTAFWVEKPTETMEVTPDCQWTAGQDPSSLIAGQLSLQGEVITVITARNV